MATLNRSKSLSAPRTPSRWLAAGLFLLAVVGCDPFSVNDAATRTLLSFVLGPIFGILGSLIFIYRPQNRIGWL